MITKKTVFILGAGASKPYGFPLGQELRDDVIRVGREISLLSTLSKLSISEQEYRDFTTDLAESGYPSVDAFLEHREKWVPLGKAAIALCLLRAESESAQRLFPPHQPRDHWYQALWARLKAPSWQAFKDMPWSVITFNYERSLEHYLVHVLCNNYQLKPHTVCSQLPVLHIHGSLGDYDQFPYGSRITQSSHEIASRSIMVVHESDWQKSFREAQRQIDGAERILFIGFGFHDQNLRKLGMPSARHSIHNRTPLVVGTHKGIKKKAWERICMTYNMSFAAYKTGTGTLSDFVTDWVD